MYSLDRPQSKRMWLQSSEEQEIHIYIHITLNIIVVYDISFYLMLQWILLVTR